MTSPLDALADEAGVYGREVHWPRVDLRPRPLEHFPLANVPRNSPQSRGRLKVDVSSKLLVLVLRLFSGKTFRSNDVSTCRSSRIPTAMQSAHRGSCWLVRPRVPAAESGRRRAAGLGRHVTLTVTARQTADGRPQGSTSTCYLNLPADEIIRCQFRISTEFQM